MSESCLEPGRLGAFVDGYCAWLLERGYAPGTVEHELRFLGVLGRWMAVEDLAVGQLDGDVIAGLVDAHRVERGAARWSRADHGRCWSIYASSGRSAPSRVIR